MRSDAEEFVPGKPLPRPSVTLSADSPEFVPGNPTGWGAGVDQNGTGPGLSSPPTDDAGTFANGADASDFNDQSAWLPPFATEEEFLTPMLLEEQPDTPPRLCVNGRRLTWELGQDWDELLKLPRGQSCESPIFSVAGTSLRLALFPAGTELSPEDSCAVALLSEESAKLTFSLFLDGRTSGSKALLGRKIFVDFRRLQAEADASGPVIGVEVHGNLLYRGF